jgi:hypothetical protein
VQSDYGDGTNGYTAIRAPSLNTSVTVKDTGLYIDAPGLNVDGGKVLTSQDSQGRCVFTFPTRLVADSENLYTFVSCVERSVNIETDYDPPGNGRLRIRTQYDSTPGKVLTVTDGDFGCRFENLPTPAIPPSPTVYTSNVALPINTTTTTIYPGSDINSTTEFWAMTVDTTFNVSPGAGTVSLSWCLYNSLGVPYGPTVATSVTAAGTVLRIVYQYAFRKVSPTEVRLTATSISTISNGTTVVRLPVTYASIDPLGGIPFIRMQKNRTTTVTVASRSAYYTALNWEPPAPVLFSAMREAAMVDESAPAKEKEEEVDLDAPRMEPPGPEEYPIDSYVAGEKEIAMMAELGVKLQRKLVDVFEGEAQEIQAYNEVLMKKLTCVFEGLDKSLEEAAQEIKRRKLI